MKIMMVDHDRVRLPAYNVSTYTVDFTLKNAPVHVDYSIRVIMLEERELNGVVRKVAYDRETDTLFVQDTAGAFG